MEPYAHQTLELMNRELHAINRALRQTFMLSGLIVVSGFGVGIWLFIGM